MIFTRVEKFVSINEPDQEGAIKNDKHCYLEIVNIVIVVSDHPNFNQVGHSTGSKDKEVPKTPLQDRDSTVSFITILIDDQTD